MSEHLSVTELDAVLRAVDLDALATARCALGPVSDDQRQSLADLAMTGEATQARANVLMCPDLLPAGVRATALLRALGEGPRSYACLAATVGVGRLTPLDVTASQRTALVAGLLDVVASDAPRVPARAAAVLGGVLEAVDAPDAVPLLVHPEPAVRRNLLFALVAVVGPAGLVALMDTAGFVEPAVADAVRHRLAADGVDVGEPGLAPPTPVLDDVPPLRAWVA